MTNANNVLLASHGTEGAQAAERMVLQMCSKGCSVHQVLVVPDLWKGMTGDDWLNNGFTRDRFRNYLETELEKEIRTHVDRMIGKALTQEIAYSAEVMIGDPGECLIEASRNAHYDLVVMGSPRPKGKQGLRSRMKVDALTRSLSMPLLIVPYPNE